MILSWKILGIISCLAVLCLGWAQMAPAQQAPDTDIHTLQDWQGEYPVSQDKIIIHHGVGLLCVLA